MNTNNCDCMCLNEVTIRCLPEVIDQVYELAHNHILYELGEIYIEDIIAYNKRFPYRADFDNWYVASQSSKLVIEKNDDEILFDFQTPYAPMKAGSLCGLLDIIRTKCDSDAYMQNVFHEPKYNNCGKIDVARTSIRSTIERYTPEECQHCIDSKE